MSEPSEAAKTKPTIRELLDRVGKGLDTRVLAERVEAALKQENADAPGHLGPEGAYGWGAAMAYVRSLLDGEQS